MCESKASFLVDSRIMGPHEATVNIPNADHAFCKL